MAGLDGWGSGPSPDAQTEQSSGRIGAFVEISGMARSVCVSAQPGFTGSGLATARQTHGGCEIGLTVKSLTIPGLGQFCECWYAGPNKRPGHLELVTAGTFVVNDSGG